MHLLHYIFSLFEKSGAVHYELRHSLSLSNGEYKMVVLFICKNIILKIGIVTDFLLHNYIDCDIF